MRKLLGTMGAAVVLAAMTTPSFSMGGGGGGGGYGGGGSMASPVFDEYTQGVRLVKHEKYSDAITAFWMYQMAAARAVMPGAAVDDVLRAYPRLLDKDLIASATRAADPSGNPSDRPLSR